MSFFDWNGDGKKDIYDDMIEYQAYKETMGEDEEEDDDFSFGKPYRQNKFDSRSRGERRFESAYNSLMVGGILFILIIAPIYTVVGFLEDPEYFFDGAFGVIIAIIAALEVVGLLVFIGFKLKKLCEPGPSKCKTSEEYIKALKIRTIVVYSLYGLCILAICILIGFSGRIKTERSYQKAINRVINATESEFYYFEFDTEKYPDYKDAEGWEIFSDAKHGYYEEAKEKLLTYEFKYTNDEQDKAIQDLKDKIRNQEKATEQTTENDEAETSYNNSSGSYASTTRQYTTRNKSTTSEDEYNVNDFAHADDFYYDHYDDFYDYEEAEDYYNEHQD